MLGALVRRGRFARFAGHAACASCLGARLAPYPAGARLGGLTFPELLRTPLRDAAGALDALVLTGSDGVLARPIRDDVLGRLRFLDDVGLTYLTLGRAAATLSTGELRRARLAAACAARMSGILFLLDEPSMGLHPVDREPLRARLRRLVSEGNTVVASSTIPRSLLAADHVIELGPGRGRRRRPHRRRGVVEGGDRARRGPDREGARHAAGAPPPDDRAPRCVDPPARRDASAPSRRGRPIRAVRAHLRDRRQRRREEHAGLRRPRRRRARRARRAHRSRARASRRSTASTASIASQRPTAS